MGKKEEKDKDKKKKIQRKTIEDSPKKKSKSSNSKKSESAKKDKENDKSKKKPKKEKEIAQDSDEEMNSDEDDLEEMILPGQKYPTPPAGDATRAFYESLLEQKADSMMAMKYCVEYGCLEQDKAKHLMEILEKEKNKKKKK